MVEHSLRAKGLPQEAPGAGGSSCGLAHPNPSSATSRACRTPVKPPPGTPPAEPSASICTPSTHLDPATSSSSQPDPTLPHAPHHDASPGGALAFATFDASCGRPIARNTRSVDAGSRDGVPERAATCHVVTRVTAHSVARFDPAIASGISRRPCSGVQGGGR